MQTSSPRPAPPQPRQLERISIEADRVARLGAMVQAFLDHFHGTPDSAGQSETAPVQIGYRSDIDRLSANIDTLDARVQALSELG